MHNVNTVIVFFTVTNKILNTFLVYHLKTRKPSLEVAPTTLAQRIQPTQKMRATITYLRFQIQVCFLADRASVLPGNVHA